MKSAPELVPILRETARAGVYHLPHGGADAIAAATRELGFLFRHVDLAGCADKTDFLDRIAAALDFPAWFGRNWDALADCLGDLDWLPAPGYVIVLEHADRFRVAAETDFVTALETLEGAAHEWADAGVPMWIFVGLAADGVVRLRSL